MQPPSIIQSARPYLRVSVDKSGRDRSPEEQLRDHKRAAERHGWTLGEEYRDKGSASRFAKKERKDFSRLLVDLDQGRFDANILILWESSRGSRKLSEWVRLLELCEERKVRIYVTSDNRLYDLGDARDRRSLQEDGVDAEYESAKVSKRTKRNTAAFAAEGRPHGRIPFGYTRIYSDPSSTVRKQVPDVEEAPVIRELYDQLYKGVPLHAIARDFKARGFLRRQRYDKQTGAPLPREPFSPAHLRSLALNRTYIGERVHDPNRRQGHATAAATVSKGTWPALTTRKKWLRVEAMLTDKDRKTTRGGKAVHLLSLIAKCDACDGTLSARSHPSGKGDPVYACRQRGCVTVDYAELTALAEEQIFLHLSRPGNLAQLTETDDAELEAARAAVTGVEKELRDLAARVGRNELSQEFAAMTAPGIEARLQEAKELETRLSTPAVLAGYLEPGQDVRQAWPHIPIAARRTIVRILCSPGYIGELRITRSPLAGHRVPVAERLKWIRK